MRPIPNEIRELYGIAERPWWKTEHEDFLGRVICTRSDGLAVRRREEKWLFGSSRKNTIEFSTLAEVQAHADAMKPILSKPPFRVGQIWAVTYADLGSGPASKIPYAKCAVFQVSSTENSGEPWVTNPVVGRWLIRDPWFPALFWGSV